MVARIQAFLPQLAVQLLNLSLVVHWDGEPVKEALQGARSQAFETCGGKKSYQDNGTDDFARQQECAQKANEYLRVSNEKLNTRNERQRVSLDTE